jgi:hypothetical protein
MNAILIDTQLFLRLIVGLGSKSDIAETKRLCSEYTEFDFERLTRFVSGFNLIATLPNILTEVSNFIGDSDMPRAQRARDAMKAIIENAVEIYQPSQLVKQQPEFNWLGITDTAQLLLLETGHSLVTNDGRLFGAALNRGRPATIFTQIPA